MTGRTIRRASLALILLLVTGAAAQRAEAQLALQHDPISPVFYFHPDQLITVYVYVQTPLPIQAYDVDVVVDPAFLKPVVVSDLSFFDGDEQLVLPPTIDAGAGVVDGIVDARLGAPSATGAVYLASVVYRVLQTGITALDFNAFTATEGFADAAGTALGGTSLSALISVELFADSDQDGLSDAYELNETQTDPNDPDTDNDGTPDGSEDRDIDGASNLEEFLAGTSSRSLDSDLDGQNDALDNCPHTYNPSQSDADGDSIGDACDPDGDNDQLDDVDEPPLGLDPNNPDTDGDTFLDGVEIALGTDPLDPASFPTAVPAIGARGTVLFILLIVLAGAVRIPRRQYPV